HFIFTNPANPHVFISVPDHPEVDRNTLKAEIRKSGKKDADFIAAYHKLFDSKKVLEFRSELDICCICHEEIGPEQEITKHPDNDLNIHSECHERIFGTR